MPRHGLLSAEGALPALQESELARLRADKEALEKKVTEMEAMLKAKDAVAGAGGSGGSFSKADMEKAVAGSLAEASNGPTHVGVRVRIHYSARG